MMHYREWTARQVRDWIEEAAATVLMLPKDWLPRKDGNSFPETVREKWKDAAGEMVYHRQPTSGELSRMEQVWTWINDLPEEERRLLYGWGEAKVTRNRTLRYFAEENSISERTLRYAVTRVCQRIADGLNRKHEIRLTAAVDPIAEIGDPVRDFSVASNNCAKPKRSPKAERAIDAKPLHDDTPEGIESFEKHLNRVNRSRRNRAKRASDRKAKREAAKRKKEAA